MRAPLQSLSSKKAGWTLALVLAASTSWSALPGSTGEEPPRASSPPPGESTEALSGGSTTIFDVSPTAYGRALANLDRARWQPMLDGKALFMRNWAGFPGGLAGPLSNAASCGACHFKDGRGRSLSELGTEAPLLLRLSAPFSHAARGADEPVYGGQLNDQAIVGVPAEGSIEVTYTEFVGRYPDGTAYSLRTPRYRATHLAYGPLAPGTLISPRISSPVFGLGLLEAIPDTALLALADPEDRDGDGIAGRPNQLVQAHTGRTVLGRFGWKANQPSLKQQIAKALSEDLGLSSPLYPEPSCTAKQEACRAVPTAASPELSEEQLEKIRLYLRLLGVPARRNVDDPTVLRGQVLFQQTGCASCHHTTFQTGEVADIPELSGQTIRPYTDLLLHDMGEALADGRPDSEASGSEWRTAPLWGLGLLETVNRQVRMLHDGRARSFEEAILWHGGEAAESRERFKQWERPDREALLAFLRSL